MRKVWARLTDQLDRIPSSWGLPIMVIVGVVFWIVVLKLVGL